MEAGMSTARRKRILVGIAVGLLAVLTLAPGAAYADAGTKATCMGHEASGVSPPGSSSELPGGMPQLKAFIDETFPTLPPGTIYSAIARLRLSSHQECDEALD